ncbi:hypothetical protein CferDRAFT_2152 [Chlorobium ferrooxidans DSM 13031]|uniref:Uncharacterized protein n=1 Tax=Chlorobium ferrooxidans DSM 13031 TaxID=377431 RepID=Q0YUL7_9CHLB|nr:hypothetical protein CferDRAFT_2152 [Chlorobium ferrooxidans DSM 13031]
MPAAPFGLIFGGNRQMTKTNATRYQQLEQAAAEADASKNPSAYAHNTSNRNRIGTRIHQLELMQRLFSVFRLNIDLHLPLLGL